ncbi:MAG: hypothetical protein KDB27_09280 [Planctomycetales bacterium]|nr:hypothetical protein [Planctomycetales bacterium]
MRSLRFACCLLPVTIFLQSDCIGGAITPVGVKATSEFGFEIFATKLIDGSGLIDFEDTPDFELDDYHDNAADWANGWHSGDQDAGIPGGLDEDGGLFTAPLVDEQIIEFDLGALHDITHAHIWQQNQSGLGVFLAPERGVDEFEIWASPTADGDDFVGIGLFYLHIEEGVQEVPAQVIEFENTFTAQRIRFDLNSAHSQLDNEFVGLGEVRFEGTLAAALLPGDFNLDGVLDAADIDALSEEVRSGTNNAAFDLNGDTVVNDADRFVWVDDFRGTYFGDSNLDGEFNSTDFVVVFTARKYEAGADTDATWATGDWNGDGNFDSTDFVRAFTSGGYEKGPRAVQAVPEPHFLPTVALMMIIVFARRVV